MQNKRIRIVAISFGLVLATLVAVVAGRASVAPERTAGKLDAPKPGQPTSRSSRRLAQMRDRQARAFRALEEAIRKQGPEPVRAQAVQLVRELTNEVRSSPRFGQGLAELTVLELDAKINTWATSVWSNKPETMPEIVKEIDRQFCEGDLAAEEYVLFGKLGLKVPELLSVRALDCVFGRRNQEDIVTWTLLDAWRFSGQPKTEAITAIEAAASDPRTKLRFMSPDEELALRMPAAR